jgi:hypothetical protein
MPFDTYSASAYTLDDTISATTDPAVTNDPLQEDSAMAGCCTHVNTCAPQPSDVTINATTTNFVLADNPASYQDEELTIVADVGTFTYTPLNTASTHVFVNGQLLADPSCWTLAGKIITFVTGVLPSNATVFVKYITRDNVSVDTVGETGTMVVFATDAVPTGWLVCDGTVVSQGLWPDLFTVIGHDYFVADATYANVAAIEAAGNFQLPDLEDTVYDGTAYVVKSLIIKT